MQQTYFTQLMPQSNWTLPKLSELPAWTDAKRVCIDIETSDPDLDELGPGVRRDRKRNFIAGIGFAIEDGPAYYLPVAHETGENLPLANVMAYLNDQLRGLRHNRALVGMNMGYDLDWLTEYGADFSRVTWFRDPQIADPLIDEYHHSYSHDAIAKRRGLPGKDERILRAAAATAFPKQDVKKILWRLDPKYVGDYALQDVREPLQILRLQERDIEREDLQEVFDLESKVLPVLVKMRRKGIPVDLNHVDRVEAWCHRREKEICARIHEVSGKHLDPDAVWQKDEALIPLLEGAGIQVPMSEPKQRFNKKKQDWETVEPKKQVLKGWLTNLSHPLGKLLADVREINKLRTTFCARVKRFAIQGADGVWRVHCTFNQLRMTKDGEDEDSDEREGKGTRTGRLSMSEYNAQQEPMRAQMIVEGEPEFDHLPQGRIDSKGKPDPWKLGEAWRHVYCAELARFWASGDYSQQEPRMECHFAELAGLEGAKKAGDLWRANPRLDGHQLVADLTGLPRYRAKEVRLGLAYGMGGAKLCKIYLKTETKWITATWGDIKGKLVEIAGDEGQAIIDKFNRGAPFIKLLSKLAQERGKARGYIVTIAKRRIRIARKKDGTPDYRLAYQLGNGLMQGGSASQTKMAMVALDADGCDMRLQVHDEINWMEDSMVNARRRREIMENVVKLTVPSVVDLECGPSYGRIGELDVAA
jgi:DNA polymerase I-like protein with 3'-5' exonuclease and polymerase domains